MTQTGYICTKYDTIKKASKTEQNMPAREYQAPKCRHWR